MQPKSPKERINFVGPRQEHLIIVGNILCLLTDSNFFLWLTVLVSNCSKSFLLFTMLSPEVWEEIPYDSKSDMWSLGILTYEMASLEVAFDADDIVGLMKKIVNSSYKPIPKLYSAELATFVNVLLQKDPKNRPSCKALMNLPAIKKIEDYIKTKNQHILRESDLDLSQSGVQSQGTNNNKRIMAKTIRFTGNFKELDLKLKKLTKLKKLREKSLMSDTSRFDIVGMKKQLERDTVKRYSRRQSEKQNSPNGVNNRRKNPHQGSQKMKFQLKSRESSSQKSRKKKNNVIKQGHLLKLPKRASNSKHSRHNSRNKVSRRENPSRSPPQIQNSQNPQKSQIFSRSPNGSHENSVRLVNYSRKLSNKSTISEFQSFQF